MPTFKLQEQVYQRIGSLLPEETSTPKFLQLYFIADYKLQAETRIGVLPPSGRIPRSDVILLLQAMIHEVNSYIRNFKYALKNAPFTSFIVIEVDKPPHDDHERRYNAPACNEVAAIIHGKEERNRYTVLNQEAALFAGFQRPIDHMTHFNSLHFSLVVMMATTSAFPFILRVANLQRLPKPYRARPSTHTVTWLGMETNILHRWRELFHQFVVDMAAKMESEWLCFIRNHQKQLRSDSYVHLRDSLRNEVNPRDLWKLCILPSTYTGGRVTCMNARRTL
ncbi:unnamed protein product [Acanthosepion pharaonis]|uniref:Helitron helicase-like domain-containing protein n=1 Tax=Acanthosepion pharaonis TaxID=158019 RepID=A0A812B0V2_ACAPH|nr:unnamed protein product [Sepia pharaonis]